MNDQSFHVPTQSFPMDVTSPTPTQLPSPKGSGEEHTPPSPKPPRPERTNGTEGENDREQIAAPTSRETLGLF
jgi:hypothetical protein